MRACALFAQQQRQPPAAAAVRVGLACGADTRGMSGVEKVRRKFLGFGVALGFRACVCVSVMLCVEHVCYAYND